MLTVVRQNSTLSYMAETVTFRPNADDMKLIERLRKRLAAISGETSTTAVIRYALREADKKQ